MTPDAHTERLVVRLLHRYAHCADRRDYDGIAGCYWPDAIDRHADFEGDAVAYVAWLREVLPAIDVSTHQFTNVLVDSVDDRTVTVETYCLNVLVYPGTDDAGRRRHTTAHLRYLDRVERRGDEWRIADRTVVTDWSREEWVTPFR